MIGFGFGEGPFSVQLATFRKLSSACHRTSADFLASKAMLSFSHTLTHTVNIFIIAYYG